MSALFDFASLLVVFLLFICATAFTRSLKPTMFDVVAGPGSGEAPSTERSGLMGFCWKMSRIGERMSEYVAAACVIMAFYTLFIKE